MAMSPTESFLTNVPDSILYAVLEHLNQGDLEAIALTNSSMRRMAYSPDIPGSPWSNIDMSKWPFHANRPRLAPKPSKFDALFFFLTTMSNSVTTVDPSRSVLPAIDELTRNTKYMVSDSSIQAAVHPIADQLVRLYCLRDTTISDLAMSYLATSVSNLKVLKIGDSKITNAGLAILGALSLTEFELWSAPAVSDEGIQLLLNGNHAFRVLKFGNDRSGCFGKVTKATVRNIALCCRALEHLDISGIGGHNHHGDPPQSRNITDEFQALVLNNCETLCSINVGYGFDTSDRLMLTMMDHITTEQIEMFKGARVQGHWDEDLSRGVWDRFVLHFRTASILFVDDVWGDNIELADNHFLYRG